MTNGEYIRQKLQAWNITDAHVADLSAKGVAVDDEYAPGDTKVQSALVDVIEELCLAPSLKNVSENGFSVSWDYANLGRYYMWLCRKLNRVPNDDVIAALEISTITDKSDIW